jgi:hypothetical protein
MSEDIRTVPFEYPKNLRGPCRAALGKGKSHSRNAYGYNRSSRGLPTEERDSDSYQRPT